MRKVVIATRDGYRRATVLASSGDWAITVRPGSLQTLTHLPTGAVCCSIGAANNYEALPGAMRVLDAHVMPFNVQTFEGVKEQIEKILLAHSLRPAWAAKAPR